MNSAAKRRSPAGVLDEAVVQPAGRGRANLHGGLARVLGEHLAQARNSSRWASGSPSRSSVVTPASSNFCTGRGECPDEMKAVVVDALLLNARPDAHMPHFSHGVVGVGGQGRPAWSWKRCSSRRKYRLDRCTWRS